MKIRYIVAAFLLTASIAVQSGCTWQERRDVAQDWATYVGATPYPDGELNKDEKGQPILDGKPDYDPKEIAEKTALELAKRAGNPADMALWAAIGGVTLAAGWFKRKFLVEKAKAAIAKIIVKKAEEVLDEEDDEDLPKEDVK